MVVKVVQSTEICLGKQFMRREFFLERIKYFFSCVFVLRKLRLVMTFNILGGLGKDFEYVKHF